MGKSERDRAHGRRPDKDVCGARTHRARFLSHSVEQLSRNYAVEKIPSPRTLSPSDGERETLLRHPETHPPESSVSAVNALPSPRPTGRGVGVRGSNCIHTANAYHPGRFLAATALQRRWPR